MDARHNLKINPIGLFIQSILIFSTYASLISMYFHNFVAEPDTIVLAQRASLYLSLCTFVACLYLCFSDWTPNAAWKTHPKRSRCMTLLIAPILYVFFFVGFSSFIPFTYTSVVGQTKTIKETISKEYVDTRMACNFRLNLKSVDSNLFHFCIRPEIFEQIDYGEHEVIVSTMQSEFGYYVNNVKFIDNQVSIELRNEKTIISYLIELVLVAMTANIAYFLFKKFRIRSQQKTIV